MKLRSRIKTNTHLTQAEHGLAELGRSSPTRLEVAQRVGDDRARPGELTFAHVVVRGLKTHTSFLVVTDDERTTYPDDLAHLRERVREVVVP